MKKLIFSFTALFLLNSFLFSCGDGIVSKHGDEQDDGFTKTLASMACFKLYECGLLSGMFEEGKKEAHAGNGDCDGGSADVNVVFSCIEQIEAEGSSISYPDQRCKDLAMKGAGCFVSISCEDILSLIGLVEGSTEVAEAKLAELAKKYPCMNDYQEFEKYCGGAGEFEDDDDEFGEAKL